MSKPHSPYHSRPDGDGDLLMLTVRSGGRCIYSICCHFIPTFIRRCDIVGIDNFSRWFVGILTMTVLGFDTFPTNRAIPHLIPHSWLTRCPTHIRPDRSATPDPTMTSICWWFIDGGRYLFWLIDPGDSWLRWHGGSDTFRPGVDDNLFIPVIVVVPIQFDWPIWNDDIRPKYIVDSIWWNVGVNLTFEPDRFLDRPAWRSHSFRHSFVTVMIAQSDVVLISVFVDGSPSKPRPIDYWRSIVPSWRDDRLTYDDKLPGIGDDSHDRYW